MNPSTGRRVLAEAMHGCCFRVNWRNVSELFGVVSALAHNAPGRSRPRMWRTGYAFFRMADRQKGEMEQKLKLTQMDLQIQELRAKLQPQ